MRYRANLLSSSIVARVGFAILCANVLAGSFDDLRSPQRAGSGEGVPRESSRVSQEFTMGEIKDAEDGKVIGVIIAKNKVAREKDSLAEKVVPFSAGDETVMKTIASHAASFIRHVNNG